MISENSTTPASKKSPPTKYWNEALHGLLSGGAVSPNNESVRRRPTEFPSAISTAAAELGIDGVRMHGWLDDDMSVAPTAGPPFHFYNIDLVADYLVSLKLKPVFELDYTPRSMAKCKGGQCYYSFHNNGGYKGLLEPPADYAVWYTLVRTLGEHLLSRYGEAVLSTWRFEVWNEPNPWIGGVDYPKQYVPLYNASATALKAVHPSLRIGGPVTATLAHLVDFGTRATWDRTRHQSLIPLDFLSSHFYPSEHNCTDPHQPYGTDPDCFVKTVLNSSKAAATARKALGHTPVLPPRLRSVPSRLLLKRRRTPPFNSPPGGPFLIYLMRAG